jgi:hypothetical protein
MMACLLSSLVQYRKFLYCIILSGGSSIDFVLLPYCVFFFRVEGYL